MKRKRGAKGKEKVVDDPEPETGAETEGEPDKPQTAADHSTNR
jgi:hypothetical protein